MADLARIARILDLVGGVLAIIAGILMILGFGPGFGFGPWWNHEPEYRQEPPAKA